MWDACEWDKKIENIFIRQRFASYIYIHTVDCSCKNAYHVLKRSLSLWFCDSHIARITYAHTVDIEITKFFFHSFDRIVTLTRGYESKNTHSIHRNEQLTLEKKTGMSPLYLSIRLFLHWMCAHTDDRWKSWECKRIRNKLRAHGQPVSYTIALFRIPFFRCIYECVLYLRWIVLLKQWFLCFAFHSFVVLLIWVPTTIESRSWIVVVVVVLSLRRSVFCFAPTTIERKDYHHGQQ